MNRFNVPADLCVRKQWVVWRYQLREGKTTKVPYRAKAPDVKASTTDPGSWARFEQAVAVLERNKADGIGFVLSEGDPYFGVDLDDCWPDGELWVVGELDSYSELSPSGRGVHVIARGSLGGGRRRGPVEIYDRGRFFCMTGERLAGVPHSPMPRQHELDQLLARMFPPQTRVQSPSRPVSVCENDRQLLARMFAASNGGDVETLYEGDWSRYRSQSEADLALCRHLAFWTGGDPDRIDALFRSSGLMREKWERAGYRGATITRALS